MFVVFGGIVDGFESFAEIEHASADFVFACRFEVLLGCEIWHGVFFGGEDTVDGGWVSSPKRAVVFFFGGIEDIDAIDAIDAIEDIVDIVDMGLVGWRR